MVSKRVMLLGALVVGVSYFLAIQRVSPSEPETHLASPDAPSTSVNAAHAGQPDARVDRELAQLAPALAE